MPRNPSPTCRACGADRDAALKEALCKPCLLKINQERCRKWREQHPDRYRASEAKRPRPERKPRIAKAKPRSAPVLVVPSTPVIIGPEAFPRVKPVGVVPGRYRRVGMGVSGWGR